MAAPALVLGGQQTGTTQWQVPDVVGATIEDARSELEPYRLSVQEVRVYSQAPKDEVVGTLPAQGDVLPERGRLVLRVSAGLPPGAVDVGALVTRLDERLSSIDALTASLDKRTQAIQGDVAKLVQASSSSSAAARRGGASGSASQQAT